MHSVAWCFGLLVACLVVSSYGKVRSFAVSMVVRVFKAPIDRNFVGG